MKQKKSFTLIEVIVVIGALALVLPALFAIIFALLREQVKLYQLSEVKRQGDYALSLMENTIRNYATHTYNGVDPATAPEVCNVANDTDKPITFFKDSYNYWFQYVISSGGIASQSEIANTVVLTSSKVNITNFSITCSRTATYSSPIITIKFQVTAGTSTTRQEERASLGYQTRIKMKSYQ